MTRYSATDALLKALSEVPTDIDFSILGKVDPMDVKPASGFAEVSRSFDNISPAPKQALTGTSTYSPVERFTSGDGNQLPTRFVVPRNSIPARDNPGNATQILREVIAQPSQGVNMATPSNSLRAALDGLVGTTGFSGVKNLATTAPAPVYTPRNLKRNNNTFDADELFEAMGVRVVPTPGREVIAQPTQEGADMVNRYILQEAAEGPMVQSMFKGMNRVAAPVPTSIKPNYGDGGVASLPFMRRSDVMDAWDSPAPRIAYPGTELPVNPAQSNAVWNAPPAAATVAPPSAPPKKSWGSKSELFADAQAGVDEAIKAIKNNAEWSAEFKSLGGTLPQQPAPKLPPPAQPDIAITPDGEVVSTDIPWYLTGRGMAGIGAGVVGAGALGYGVTSMMQPQEEEVFYQSPGYGQMPRSFA